MNAPYICTKLDIAHIDEHNTAHTHRLASSIPYTYAHTQSTHLHAQYSIHTRAVSLLRMKRFVSESRLAVSMEIFNKLDR